MRISIHFTEYICKDLIYDIDGKLIPANIYTVLTSTSTETTIAVPCTSTNWTLIQQRVDGSVSFERQDTVYKEGFGDPEGNYFHGVNPIRELTANPKKLQIFLESFEGDVALLLYQSFKIGNNIIS